MTRTPYVRHLRHRLYERTRHARRFLAWLEEMATKFSTTADIVFEYLKRGFTAQQIENATAIPPLNTELPVISGTAQEGQELSTTNGSWEGVPAPTFTYQWQRASVPISGATASTYTLTSDDVSHFINVQVTGTNSEGDETVTSEAVGPIAAL